MSYLDTSLANLVDSFSQFHNILSTVDLQAIGEPATSFTHAYLEVNLKLNRLQKIVTSLVDSVLAHKEINKDALNLILLDIKKELVEINSFIKIILPSLVDIKAIHEQPKEKEQLQRMELWRAKLQHLEKQICYTVVFAAMADVMEMFLAFGADKEERKKKLGEIMLKFVEAGGFIKDANDLLLCPDLDIMKILDLNNLLKKVDFRGILINTIQYC